VVNRPARRREAPSGSVARPLFCGEENGIVREQTQNQCDCDCQKGGNDRDRARLPEHCRERPQHPVENGHAVIENPLPRQCERGQQPEAPERTGNASCPRGSAFAARRRRRWFERGALADIGPVEMPNRSVASIQRDLHSSREQRGRARQHDSRQAHFARDDRRMRQRSAALDDEPSGAQEQRREIGIQRRADKDFARFAPGCGA
jgi:hypothetical protein